MRGTLLGNYRVVDQLGEGGMGVVYIGRHEALGHRVVVKVLQPELSRDAVMVQRFVNEAQAATEIRNPGIAQIFDFGTTPDGRAYIVMELLEGETLAARLTHRRYDHAECCRLGRQVANVLQAAHAAGITHRDLKPDNLFLVSDSEVIGGERIKVLDFGIAKLAGDGPAGVRTHTGLVMGTPDYMSPEQCRSANTADPRSDIYSLGCILFEIACRRPPFRGQGLGDIVAAHLHEPPPDPRYFTADLPAAFAALIRAMLAKHPDARPQSMAAVSHVLDEILRAPPPPAPPPGFAAGFVPAQRTPRGLAMARAPTPSPAPAMPRPMPQILPTARTLSGSATMSRYQRRAAGRRFGLALSGAAVIIGAVVAIVTVLATGARSSPWRSVSYREIAAQQTAAAGAVASTGVAAGPSIAAITPPPGSAAAPRTVAPPPTAASVEAVCRAHETSHAWDALARCAEQLQPLAPERAAALATRAAEETRSAPRIAAARAALDGRSPDDQLARARAELDQVWPQSVGYAALKQAYDAAETMRIDELAVKLDGLKTPSCEAYDQALAQARAADPPRVAAEAARRSPCRAPARCNADALATRALAQYQVNRLADAFALYKEAFDCRPDPAVLLRALVMACNLRDLARARSCWKPLPAALRTRARTVCEHYDITEAMLSEP